MNEADVTGFLDAKGIGYELFRHPAVFSANDGLPESIGHPDAVTKNLFLRDDKRQNRYLVVMPVAVRADLKALAAAIPSRHLSFVPEDELQATLGVSHGSVTPLALLGAPSAAVAVIDARLLNGLVGVHPLHNEATLFLQCADLMSLLEDSGTTVMVANL